MGTINRKHSLSTLKVFKDNQDIFCPCLSLQNQVFVYLKPTRCFSECFLCLNLKLCDKGKIAALFKVSFYNISTYYSPPAPQHRQTCEGQWTKPLWGVRRGGTFSRNYCFASLISTSVLNAYHDILFIYLKWYVFTDKGYWGGPPVISAHALTRQLSLSFLSHVHMTSLDSSHSVFTYDDVKLLQKIAFRETHESLSAF